MTRKNFLKLLLMFLFSFFIPLKGMGFCPSDILEEENFLEEGTEVFVPTFELDVYPQIRLSEIKARRFYIVDRVQMKSKEAIPMIKNSMEI